MLFNRFKTIRLKKIKVRRLRRGIRSNIKCLLERQNLYERINAQSNAIRSIVVKYKMIYNEFGDAILVLRFIKSGRPIDNGLQHLKEPLETIFDLNCSEPFTQRTYVEYHLILEVFEDDEQLQMEIFIDDSNF